MLLCEDPAHESFFRPICERHFGRTVRTIVLPKGQGSGRAWVLKRYPAEVSALRSRGSERVGLLVVVDGDTAGRKATQREVAGALAREGIRPIAATERVAICIPTRNIETWLVSLAFGEAVDETQDYKRKWQARTRAKDERKHRLRLARDAWGQSSANSDPPSLVDARHEFKKLTR